MKTLHQFMGEAIESLPAEEINEDVLITEDDIIDSIVEALEGEEVTEEEFVELYNMVIEQLTGEEASEEEILDEEHGSGRYDDDYKSQEIVLNGKHVADIHTYRGRSGGTISHTSLPGANNRESSAAAQKKYGLGDMDTKAEMLKKIKTYHKNTNEANEADLKAPIKESNELNEAHDVELKPHENGTHYIVHKIHPKSGIESDQLKKGEKISDTHVDDLNDMGYKVKIHKA